MCKLECEIWGIICFTVGEVIVIKWRDTAWKEALCDGAQSAIEYLMPDLAADMDPTREICGIPGIELFSEGADSDKGMRELDVFFSIPMLDGETGNVALFVEQQHEPNASLPERVFETYIRLREKWRLRTTCIVVYTGSAPNVNTYAESAYGCEISMKYRTYYLPEKSADELRADNHPLMKKLSERHDSLHLSVACLLRALCWRGVYRWTLVTISHFVKNTPKRY